ncbi:hypothetical protein MFMK1_001341 [Metallumcola ferriviriculae]|uniref:SMODS and SLOG-associating 2TM effector domain-containing protein n=1 Tax=Metallumcola ferriviriculae TaxID=3039180 RepID=A0AAU0UMW2_9FIRM|nr:hypothetical protein MFMK1_001341 [Desulfitibacteraceae bacterium MK1]
MENNYKRDIERQFGVIDMMLTAHSFLRDRYDFYAQIFDVLQFVVAVVLNSAVLADVFNLMQIGKQVTNIIIGISSIILLLLSLTTLVMGWKDKALKHNEAAGILSNMKLNCRLLKLEPVLSLEQVQKQTDAYNNKLNDLPISIPERQFLKLKAYHQRKKMLSEAMSEYPGSSAFLIRMMLWLKVNLKVLRSMGKRGEEN